MTEVVTNTAALMTALKSSHAGDTIALASGDYAELTLTNLNLGGVTITSADPGAQAILHGVNLANSSGVTFTNLDMVYSAGSTGSVVMVGSSDMTFDHVKFYNTTSEEIGTAVAIKNGSHITVTNSDIHGFGAAVSHVNSTGVTITNNTIHGISLDGIRGGGSSYVTITGNTLTDFHPIQYAHNDAIQFWTSGTTTPTHDILIANNTITRGDGRGIQGIFMGNEAGIAYQNVTIQNNAVVGHGYHAITLINADGVVVDNNLVLAYKDQQAWIQLSGVTHGTLSNNESAAYVLTLNTDLVQTTNATLTSAAVGDDSGLNYWLTHDGAAPTITAVAAVAAVPPVGAPSAQPAAVPQDTLGQVFTGTNGVETITGTLGADTINGGMGADTLKGDVGNDRYILWDNAYVIENPGAGIDTVQTTLGIYVLRANVENLVLDGGLGQRGYGNDLGNVITGNATNDYLYGMAGDDTLISAGGADNMSGAAGKDVFEFDKLPTKGVSTIADFVKGDDHIDLHNLLTDYNGSDPVADGWVKFTTDATSTTIYVDQDGAAGPAAFVAVAKVTAILNLAATDLAGGYAPAPVIAPVITPVVDTVAPAGPDAMPYYYYDYYSDGYWDSKWY